MRVFERVFNHTYVIKKLLLLKQLARVANYKNLKNLGNYNNINLSTISEYI